MADTSTTQSSTAAAPAPGDASTPVAAIDSPLTLPPPGTPVDIDSLLAGGDDAKALGTETQSGAGGGKIEGEPVKTDEPKVEPDTTTTTTETEDGDPEEKEEASDLEKAKDTKVPDWVQPRLGKYAAKCAKLTERAEAAESKLQAKEEAEAQAAANPSTPLPASAIAHLDTEEKLTERVNTAVNNLQWAESRKDFERYFADDGESVPESQRQTAEEKFQAFKAQELFILANQDTQRKLLTQRKAALEDVKKSVPAMFKAGTEEHAFYAKALANPDLRTDPEFHQLMADALRGKRARLEMAKATAAKVPVKKDVVKVPPIPVPNIATARASVRTDDAPDARAQAWQKAAKQEPVSIDDMMDAGALAAA